MHASKVGLATFLFLLMSLAVLSAAQAAQATASSNTAPASTDNCGSSVQQTLDSLNKADAIANARESSFYSQDVASYYNPTYYGVFQLGKILNPSTCEHQVENFNVVFLLHNSTGSLEADLVVTESAGLSVIGALVNAELASSVNTYTNTNHAGYETSANSAATVHIYSTYADYTQPTPSYPSGGCGGETCQVNSWTGLETGLYQNVGSSSGAAHLAQAGTTSWCNQSSCTTSNGHAGYFAWEETIAQDGATVNCTAADESAGGLQISGGDTIYTYTINAYYSGGSNTSYSFYIDDTTSLSYCNLSTTSSYITAPVYSLYMTELPIVRSDPLAQFGTVTFSNIAFDNSSSGYNINAYDAYHAGYYQSDVFKSATNYPTCSPEVLNIQTSSISSSNVFTNQWQSSQYTPALCA